MILTQEQDKDLRDYAKWLNPDIGEDAYHTAICDTIRLGKEESIKDIKKYFRVVIKYSLYHIFRHEKSERKNVQAFINNDPIPMQVGLAAGRLKLNTCKRGHEWKEEHIFYVQGRRGCLICKKAREREQYCSHKKLKGQV